MAGRKAHPDTDTATGNHALASIAKVFATSAFAVSATIAAVSGKKSGGATGALTFSFFFSFSFLPINSRFTRHLDTQQRLVGATTTTAQKCMYTYIHIHKHTHVSGSACMVRPLDHCPPCLAELFRTLQP
ncbi:unnamed protein product [Ceratitis capitata]|uniref:(Mediterranean fruit fly) hypothetical protein n=1 Tax=Ceratitis capitata TaxID=7213 RepID=A0A811VJ14_CERCA|nr:unnamed protein product [Ceratitis capitata]